MLEPKAKKIDIDADVLIVGYGPVGMSLAILAALQGLKVHVLERHATLWAGPRAGHIDGEIMRIFQNAGVGRDVERIARAVTEFDIKSSQGEMIQSLNLSEGSTNGWKPSYLLYSPTLESILDKRARELGVKIDMDTTVTSLACDSDIVTAEMYQTSMKSQKRYVCARFVVGADGANSVVRRTLNINQSEFPFHQPEHLVIDFEHNDPDVEIPDLDSTAHIVSAYRPYLAGRWSGERWSRWEFARRSDESLAWLSREETAWELLAPWGLTPKHGQIKRHTIYNFEAKLAHIWQHECCFLMGDAAHTMPPYMGQGMCSGIRDAVNLSWKLAHVTRGIATRRLLETYQLERAPHVEAITQMSIAIGDRVSQSHAPSMGASGLKSPKENNEANVPSQHFPGLSRAGFFAADTTNCVGRPMIQARVIHQGKIVLLDDLLKPGWVLITRCSLRDTVWTKDQQLLIQRCNISIAHVSRGVNATFVDLDGDYDAWYRKQNRKAVLVRPDHYVFGTVENCSEAPFLLDMLEAALAQQME